METWRDIPGIPHYQASCAGRIRSLDRMVRCKSGVRLCKGRVLSCFPAKSTGYLQCDIAGVRHSVHRLVALAWCEGHFSGAVVDHINGSRSDNRPENLSWVTQSENQLRSYRMGRVGSFTGRSSSDHPTSKAVISKCITTGQERFWPSAMDAVRQGFDSATISRCCAGKVRSHKGYTWRFASDEMRAA